MEEIGIEEYKLGHLMLFAEYPKTEIVKYLSINIARERVCSAIFHLRPDQKEEISKQIQDEELEKCIYLDDNYSVEHIYKKCDDLLDEFGRFIIMLDFEDVIPYSKEELKKLYELSLNNNHNHIIITSNLKESAKAKEYPDLEDFDNKDILDIADVVVFANDQVGGETVIVKNNYGKVGIVKDKKLDGGKNVR